MSTPASISALAAFATVTALATAALVPAPAVAHFNGGYSGGEHSSPGYRVISGSPQPYEGSDWYARRYGPPYYGYRPSYHYYEPNYNGIRAGAPPAAPPPDVVLPGPPAFNPNCLSKSYLPDGTVVFADNCTNETATSGPPEGPPPARRWRGIEK